MKGTTGNPTARFSSRSLSADESLARVRQRRCACTSALGRWHRGNSKSTPLPSIRRHILRFLIDSLLGIRSGRSFGRLIQLLQWLVLLPSGLQVLVASPSYTTQYHTANAVISLLIPSNAVDNNAKAKDTTEDNGRNDRRDVRRSGGGEEGQEDSHDTGSGEDNRERILQDERLRRHELGFFLLGYLVGVLGLVGWQIFKQYLGWYS